MLFELHSHTCLLYIDTSCLQKSKLNTTQLYNNNNNNAGRTQIIMPEKRICEPPSIIFGGSCRSIRFNCTVRKPRTYNRLTYENVQLVGGD